MRRVAAAPPPPNNATTNATRIQIALGAAVRTKYKMAPTELQVATILAPSIARTVGRDARGGRVDDGFDYTLYLGYDAGDPTYDDAASLAAVGAHLAAILAGTAVRVVAVRYGGEDKGAPCWVWNKLLARACKEGASYFYQLNDDLKLLTEGWAPRFVGALQASTPPDFGIAGPIDLNNEKLMTQSFVSCGHLRIFNFTTRGGSATGTATIGPRSSTPSGRTGSPTSR